MKFNKQDKAQFTPKGYHFYVAGPGRVDDSKPINLAEEVAPDVMIDGQPVQASAQQIPQPVQQAPQSVQPPVRQASSVPVGGSRFCMYCGKPLGEGARFCAGCGKPVGASAPQKNLCPKCGREFQSDERFCISCGTKNPLT